MPRPARRLRVAPRTRVAVAVAAAVAVTLTGAAACGIQEDDQDGFGLPTLSAAEVPGPPVPLTGVLHVERNGCFTWEDATGARRWVVWPEGGRHEGDRVALPDGGLVGEGDRLEGTGVVADASVLPDWAAGDSYFASFGGFCDAEATGIVVLTDVRPG